MDGNRMYKQRTVQALFPESFRTMFCSVMEDYQNVSEIRIRQNGPVCIMKGKKIFYLDDKGKYTPNIQNAVSVSGSSFQNLFSHICRHSIYAFEEELKNGYLTVEGGHRIGVVGQTVWEGNEIKGLKHYNALNIRIAHEIKGVADMVLPYLTSEGELRSTLIVSMPGCGKTTLLRDLIRKTANGGRTGKARNVCIIDERSEIASSYLGVAQNDVGLHTDVLDACPKAQGILWVLRSMAPEVIAVDELGDEKDYQAIQQAFYLGCRVFATVHGRDYENICQNPNLYKMLSPNGFQRIVILDGRDAPGKIIKICNERGVDLLK